MNPDAFIGVLFAFFCGLAVGYFLTWRHARKIEDILGPNALRTWENYNAHNAQARGQKIIKWGMDKPLP